MFYGITDIKTFVFGTIFIVVLPGPNSIYIMLTSARYGIAEGYKGAAGVFLGDLILMTLTATGVASIIRANPGFFVSLKYIGACYLVFLGFNMLRSAFYIWIGNVVENIRENDFRPRNAFHGALVISLTNPKAILFYLSFFIQFVSPSYEFPVLSFLVLGSVVQICTFIYLSILIWGGTFLASKLRSRRKISAVATGCIGWLFIDFGSKLAFSNVI